VGEREIRRNYAERINRAHETHRCGETDREREREFERVTMTVTVTDW